VFDPLNKAIVIMFLDGYSHKDISEAMGISLSNVGKKIIRIKTQLKKKFKQ
jgi:RNA polymerase sigma-70 factor (ECF subfamily)